MYLCGLLLGKESVKKEGRGSFYSISLCCDMMWHDITVCLTILMMSMLSVMAQETYDADDDEQGDKS